MPYLIEHRKRVGIRSKLGDHRADSRVSELLACPYPLENFDGRKGIGVKSAPIRLSTNGFSLAESNGFSLTKKLTAQQKVRDPNAIRSRRQGKLGAQQSSGGLAPKKAA